jgi:hypothetical protein
VSRRPKPSHVAVALAVLVVCLSGCQAVDDARDTADRTKDCATIVSKVTGIDLNSNASAEDVQRAVAELERTIDTLDNEDVKAAGRALVRDAKAFQQALSRADQADVNRALTKVTQSAENLARTCNVPIDQLTGG